METIAIDLTNTPRKPLDPQHVEMIRRAGTEVCFAAGEAIFVAPDASPEAIEAALAAVGGVLFLRRMFRHAFWDKLDAALARLRRDPLRVGAVCALSLVVQASFVAGNAALGDAAGVDAPWSAWFLAWPLAKLVALAPVSIAGVRNTTPAPAVHDGKNSSTATSKLSEANCSIRSPGPRP